MNSTLQLQQMERDMRKLQKAFDEFQSYLGRPSTFIDVRDPKKTEDLTQDSIAVLDKLIRTAGKMLRTPQRAIAPRRRDKDHHFHGYLGHIRGNLRKLIRQMQDTRYAILSLQSAALDAHGKHGQAISLLNDMREQAKDYQKILKELKIVDSSSDPAISPPPSEGISATGVVDGIWLLTSLTIALHAVWKKWKK